MEIDRFTDELIDENVTFLYGDTYYTDEAMRRIYDEAGDKLVFFGRAFEVFAVKVFDPECMRNMIDKVKRLYAAKRISECRGWQLYLAYSGYDFGTGSYTNPAIPMVLIEDDTRGFNVFADYERFIFEGAHRENV